MRMKLYIKQKVFSWGDRFSIKDEYGEDRYFVEGEVFSLGKKLHVYDKAGKEIAYMEQQLFTFLPRYHVYIGGRLVTQIVKEFSFLFPKYSIAGLDWVIEGSFLEHDYEITQAGCPIVSIQKEWMTWGDSYELTIRKPEDELIALMVVLTIDCVIDNASNN